MKNYMPRVVGICLLLGIVFSLSPARAATYTDVGKNHWAYTYIQYLSEKDVLAGDGNGRFRPDATVTRAEFIKMMAAAFGLRDTKPVSYTKVPDWARKYVEAAAAQGFLLNYKTDADFSAALSRQEAVALLMRYLEFEADKDFDRSKIKDFDEITEGYRPYVLAAVSNGIVSGYEDGSFRPKKVLTRAEALSVLYQAAGSIYNASTATAETGGGKNATVNTSVTLSGISLSGNVYLTEGAQFVTLSGCTVEGTLYVRTGSYVNLAHTKVDKIVVLGDGATFSLSNGTEIARMEAYGKTEAVVNATCALTTAIFYDGAGESSVKGTGKLNNFGVYCSGAVCEIEPEEYYVATGCSAQIGGIVYGPGSGKFESCGLSMAQAWAEDGKLKIQANALADGTVYAAVWMNHEQPLSAAQIQAQALQSIPVKNGGIIQAALECPYDPAHYTVGLVLVPDGQAAAAFAPLYTQDVITRQAAAMGTKAPQAQAVSAPSGVLHMGAGMLVLEFDQLLYYKKDDGTLAALDAASAVVSLSAQSASGAAVEAGTWAVEVRTDEAKTKLYLYFANGITAQTSYTLTLSDRLFTVYGSTPQTLVYTSAYSETASYLQPALIPETNHILQENPLTITMPEGVCAMRYTYTVNAQEPSLSMIVYGDAQLSFNTLPANSHVRISASALTASGMEVGCAVRGEYIVNAAPIIVIGGVSYAGEGNTAAFAGPVSVSALAPSGLNGALYTVRLYVDGEESPLAGIVESAGVQVSAELYFGTEKIGESTVTLR